jgi:peptidoglycan-N-acetylglucosamine deacetylase
VKKLTITFDNGPDPDCTPRVLDTLADRGIRATFFVCGLGNMLHPAHPAASQEGRALMARAQADGHWIGNHSLTHTVELGTTIDPATIDREVGQNQTLLSELNDRRLFRPYMAGGQLGERTFSPPAIRYLMNNRHTVVLFTSCPRDWERPDDWPEQALRDIHETDWTLVILHDVARYGGMKQLDRFLDEVDRRNVDIVQDFPESCTPLVDGCAIGSLDGLVSGPVPFEPLPVSAWAIPTIPTSLPA